MTIADLKKHARKGFGLAPVLLLAMSSGPVSASILDASGDFLTTYTGPKNGDLDVLSVDARRFGEKTVTLKAEMNGAIGYTAGAAYVWGINRGAGVEPFPTLDPPTGKGVFFDSFVILSPKGTATLTDLLTGKSQTLDPSSISIVGSTISLSLAKSLLPSNGFSFGDYAYNFWPRFAPYGVHPGENTQISDFAPNDRSFAAAVPEPASWAMMIAGFALVGAAGRRRALAQVVA